MHIDRRNVWFALAAVLSLQGATIAAAQPDTDGYRCGGMMGAGGQGMMDGRGMMGGQGMMTGGQGMMGGVGQRWNDNRLTFLKSELKITKAQETQWNAYADAVRATRQDMANRCSAMMAKRGSAPVRLPERLDLHEQFMSAHLDQVRALNKTLKALYAVLDETQKKTADELIWSPMGMM